MPWYPGGGVGYSRLDVVYSRFRHLAEELECEVNALRADPSQTLDVSLELVLQVVQRPP